MSGLCPFAEHKLLPVASNDPAIKPRLAILHVDGGGAFSLFSFFRRNQESGGSGVESHFHIRGDGAIEQYRSIYREADANYKANPFAVSIETQGKGDGVWTPAQLASIKRLLLWLNAEAGIPLQVPATWDGSGVGYHIQFGTPGYWTKYAKSCPGPKRIAQYRDNLVPWMRTALAARSLYRSDADLRQLDIDVMAAINSRADGQAVREVLENEVLPALRKARRIGVPR